MRQTAGNDLQYKLTGIAFPDECFSLNRGLTCGTDATSILKKLYYTPYNITSQLLQQIVAVGTPQRQTAGYIFVAVGTLASDRGHDL